MTNTNNKFDDILFEILKECKDVPTFFDVIFGFLRRRSDFFVVATGKNSPVGLLPGMAAGMVQQMYHKWEVGGSLQPSQPQMTQQQPQKQPTKSTLNTTESFNTSESYNGAKHEKYSWSQNISELDINVKIPENTKKKELFVDLQPTKILVKSQTTDEVYVGGDFPHKIKNNEAIWSIDGAKLEIHLEKSTEVWWDCLVTTEDRLDLRKIDCSRPYEDLSEAAQAKIEELKWNHERQRLGLPTSDQIDLENKLKKAWNADGSPFTGPYDPTSVILN